jgi:hypothetical protein
VIHAEASRAFEAGKFRVVKYHGSEKAKALHNIESGAAQVRFDGAVFKSQQLNVPKCSL